VKPVDYETLMRTITTGSSGSVPGTAG